MGAGIFSFLSPTFHMFSPLFYHCSAIIPCKHIELSNDETFSCSLDDLFGNQMEFIRL